MDSAYDELLAELAGEGMVGSEALLDDLDCLAPIPRDVGLITEPDAPPFPSLRDSSWPFASSCGGGAPFSLPSPSSPSSPSSASSLSSSVSSPFVSAPSFAGSSSPGSSPPAPNLPAFPPSSSSYPPLTAPIASSGSCGGGRLAPSTAPSRFGAVGTPPPTRPAVGVSGVGGVARGPSSALPTPALKFPLHNHQSLAARLSAPPPTSLPCRSLPPLPSASGPSLPSPHLAFSSSPCARSVSLLTPKPSTTLRTSACMAASLANMVKKEPKADEPCARGLAATGAWAGAGAACAKLPTKPALPAAAVGSVVSLPRANQGGNVSMTRHGPRQSDANPAAPRTTPSNNPSSGRGAGVGVGGGGSARPSPNPNPNPNPSPKPKPKPKAAAARRRNSSDSSSSCASPRSPANERGAQGGGSAGDANKRKKRDRVCDVPDDQLSKEQLAKRQRRRELNKIAAQQSRARKQLRITELEEQVRELKSQNAALGAQVNNAASENQELRVALRKHGIEGVAQKSRVWHAQSSPKIIKRTGAAVLAVVLFATVATQPFSNKQHGSPAPPTSPGQGSDGSALSPVVSHEELEQMSLELIRDCASNHAMVGKRQAKAVASGAPAKAFCGGAGAGSNDNHEGNNDNSSNGSDDGDGRSDGDEDVEMGEAIDKAAGGEGEEEEEGGCGGDRGDGQRGIALPDANAATVKVKVEDGDEDPPSHASGMYAALHSYLPRPARFHHQHSAGSLASALEFLRERGEVGRRYLVCPEVHSVVLGHEPAGGCEANGSEPQAAKAAAAVPERGDGQSNSDAPVSVLLPPGAVVGNLAPGDVGEGRPWCVDEVVCARGGPSNSSASWGEGGKAVVSGVALRVSAAAAPLAASS